MGDQSLLVLKNLIDYSVNLSENNSKLQFLSQDGPVERTGESLTTAQLHMMK